MKSFPIVIILLAVIAFAWTHWKKEEEKGVLLAKYRKLSALANMLNWYTERISELQQEISSVGDSSESFTVSVVHTHYGFEHKVTLQGPNEIHGHYQEIARMYNAEMIIYSNIFCDPANLPTGADKPLPRDFPPNILSTVGSKQD